MPQKTIHIEPLDKGFIAKHDSKIFAKESTTQEKFIANLCEHFISANISVGDRTKYVVTITIEKQ